MAKKRKANFSESLSADFLAKLKTITAKRAKTVIDHILEYGFVTTEDLSTKYGYDHAPRAARDVREQGIPLETFKVTAANGRKIAAYRFGDPSNVKSGRDGGRTVWPKELKALLADLGGKSVRFVTRLMNCDIFKLTTASHTKWPAINLPNLFRPSSCLSAVPVTVPSHGRANIVKMAKSITINRFAGTVIGLHRLSICMWHCVLFGEWTSSGRNWK